MTSSSLSCYAEIWYPRGTGCHEECWEKLASPSEAIALNAATEKTFCWRKLVPQTWGRESWVRRKIHWNVGSQSLALSLFGQILPMHYCCITRLLQTYWLKTTKISCLVVFVSEGWTWISWVFCFRVSQAASKMSAGAASYIIWRSGEGTGSKIMWLLIVFLIGCQTKSLSLLLVIC